ncbi:MAG: hypothetical protein CME86_22255 [Herbaspirillum sp.]|nr:hypothetical protein [Herbaspirillum sp.]
MIKASVVKSAVREIVKHAEGRQRVLIFACGVKHAEAVRVEVQRQTSENCDFVCGETPYMFRDEVLRRFQSPSGDLKYLVNVNILAEGFDAPGIDCIALMRATKSPGLYYQMVGRGLRTCEAKESCLVLDYGENIIRHGPIDRVRPKREKSGDGSGDAPTKFCPQCQTAVILACAACPECGYEWPVPEPTHNASASGAGILSSQHHLEWHRVKNVCYGSHSKRGAPEDHPKTLRVDYDIGCYRMISEWVCVEHPEGSFAHERAALWWSERTREAMPPTAAEAAVVARSQSKFKQPSEIEVCTKAEERWPEISNHRFDGDIRQDEYFTRITGEWHEAEEVPF